MYCWKYCLIYISSDFVPQPLFKLFPTTLPHLPSPPCAPLFHHQAHGGEAITSLVHSENGYHFASATKSGTVQVWDLRKMKLLTTLNEGGAEVGSVGSVAFSPSEGKLIAYGGANGSFTVVAVKDWDNKESFKVPSSKGVSGLAWLDGGAAIATCSDAERPVRFWGAPAEE